MDSKGIFEALQAKFGEDVVFGYEPPKLSTLDDHFFVRPDRVVELLTYLRDDPAYDFDYLECLSGVDYPDALVVGPTPPEGEEAEKGTIHVVYHLRSYDKKHRAVVKVSLPRSDPRVNTASTVWSAANWQERECFDLLGVLFTGHPDLRRIMLPDDWVGHPLRKDYQEASSYQGIPTTRPNPLDLLTIKKPDAKAEAKPKADAKPKAEPKPKPEAKPKADKDEAKPKAEPKADKDEAEAKPKAEPKADKDEAEAKPKAEPKADKDEAEARPKAEPKADKDEAKTIAATEDGDTKEPKKDDKPVDEKG